MYRFLFFLFVLFPCFAIAMPKERARIQRVIYITLDGTRWQDVFNRQGSFKKLWKVHAKKGIFYGNPSGNTRMEVASIPISLPSYQSQMSGSIQPCRDNNCEHIHEKTMLENMITTLHLPKKDVVTFASWHKISKAVEHEPGVLFTNIGNRPLYDPDSQKADAVMAKLNAEQSIDKPKDGDRFDKYTFAQAMHYFDKYQPRFMWIALADADNAAHQNNKEKYYQTLVFYDNALDELFTTLNKKKLDKNTLVIITTDHGRGRGNDWINHGPKLPESRKIWAFVVNGQLVPNLIDQNIYYYSTLSMRPTIESALKGNDTNEIS